MTQQQDSIAEGGLNDLSAQEVAAIGPLITESTIERAADRVGVHERTLRRWLAREDFRRVYHATLRTTYEHASARLQNAAAKAVGTLAAVMVDDEAPAAARVTAARSVLENGARAIELAEVIVRLDALEGRVSGAAMYTRQRREES